MHARQIVTPGRKEIEFIGKCILFFISIWFVCISGCNNSNERSLDPNISPIIEGEWYRPMVLVSWQWQLNGPINVTYEVDIYDIDLFDASTTLIQSLRSSGKKVICYFSAGSFEDWRSDASQFVQSDLGNTLDGWPDERWLDIRSSGVHEIMTKRLDLAQQKQCDGVEPDNMDGYTNSTGFGLDSTDQIAYNRFIANAAHLRGLSVGLKNDLEQVQELVDYFDFSVNEQCHEYDECNDLLSFIDQSKPILNAEYKQEYVENTSMRLQLCNQANSKGFSTLVLPLELDDSFRFSCF